MFQQATTTKLSVPTALPDDMDDDRIGSHKKPRSSSFVPEEAQIPLTGPSSPPFASSALAAASLSGAMVDASPVLIPGSGTVGENGLAAVIVQ